MSDELNRQGKRHRPANSGGTGFYITRDRPFVTMKEYRDRRRDPEARQAVKLARELTKLSGEFPRFKLALNQLGHHVLTQVRSPAWKARTVINCLHHRQAFSVRELCKTTGLDFVSLTATLAQLRSSDRVVACNRAGKPLLIDDGRSSYWLKK